MKRSDHLRVPIPMQATFERMTTSAIYSASERRSAERLVSHNAIERSHHYSRFDQWMPSEGALATTWQVWFNCAGVSLATFRTESSSRTSQTGARPVRRRTCGATLIDRVCMHLIEIGVRERNQASPAAGEYGVL